jgi:hypothetical protein
MCNDPFFLFSFGWGFFIIFLKIWDKNFKNQKKEKKNQFFTMQDVFFQQNIATFCEIKN